MSFITKEDFTSHIYEEALNTISRGNAKKLDDAIQAAMNQAKRSMKRYDTSTIFEITDEAEKAPYAELIIYIKDIAKWHFIGVCNVTVDYEDAEKRYKSAVSELKKISTGENIDGWPLNVEDTQTLFRSGSAPKFNHYF